MDPPPTQENEGLRPGLPPAQENESLISGPPSTQENEGLIPGPPTTKADERGSSHDQKTHRSLRESSPSWFWRVGISAVLLIVPIAYFALSMIVASLGNQKKSSFGDNVLEVLTVASTIWPISFAAVFGPFLKTLALQRAERGSTLGSLEFLLTSQTTISAFKNIFTLRCVQTWSIAVVAIWCLSPLGGQAAVRSLQLQPTKTTTEVPAAHFFSHNLYKVIVSDHSDSLLGNMNVFTGGSVQSSLMTGLRTVIGSAFSRSDILVSNANGSSKNFPAALSRLGGRYQAARLGQQDPWRNVRIPFMEQLPGYNAQSPTTWISVPSDEVVPYASFIGVPIRGGSFSRAGNSTMVLKSRYITLECGDAFSGEHWLGLNTTSPKAFFHQLDSPELPLQFFSGQTATKLQTEPNMWMDIVNSPRIFDEHFGANSSSDPSYKIQLIVGGLCEGSKSYRQTTVRVCNASTSYVDVAVECARSSNLDDLECQAKQIRQAPSLPFSVNLTDLSSMEIFVGIVSEMPFTTASYSRRQSSLVEQYIQDPPMMFDIGKQYIRDMYPACFSNLSAKTFEARFATALNTFIMASYNNSVLTGADGTSLENRGLMWQETTANWTEFTGEIYVLKAAWFPVYLLSTLVLFVCATANVVIRHGLMAPDFLDSVDGLTRDSPFIDISKEGSGESAQDRLQRLKHVRVQICDVQQDLEVGKIALTTNLRDTKLDWKRAYV